MIGKVGENHARDERLRLLVECQLDVVVSGKVDVEFGAEVLL